MICKENKQIRAIKNLYKEYKQFQKNPLLNFEYTVGLIDNDNLFHWKFTLSGPKDSPYEGGFFLLTADFPENYPDSKPEIRFVNKIYHLNVSPINGHVSISTLNNWIPGTPMIKVISDIFTLFYEQNPDNSYSSEMAREYKTDRKEFNRKAQEWTNKYAKCE